MDGICGMGKWRVAASLHFVRDDFAGWMFVTILKWVTAQGRSGDLGEEEGEEVFDGDALLAHGVAVAEGDGVF